MKLCAIVKCVNKLVQILNKIIEQEEVKENWKATNTTLILKKKSPMVADLRPIALANMPHTN